MKVKRVIWDKKALETVRCFSVEVRQEIGDLLRILQDGQVLGMPQSKPMKQLASSAFELRIKGRTGIKCLRSLLDETK